MNICLIGLVKDVDFEAQLLSYSPIIDQYYIADFSSNDQTIKIIKNTMNNASIPGTIIKSSWISFGHNYNDLMLNIRSDLRGNWSLIYF